MMGTQLLDSTVEKEKQQLMLSKHQIKGKLFLVQSVFSQESEETVGTILLKLMRDDVENT